MRVIHISPTPFGTTGLFGGGERYPLELARALGSQVECELITFARPPYEMRERGGLRIRALRPVTWAHAHPAHPLPPGLVNALAEADLIHTHHMRSMPSRLAVIAARARGQHAVTTDHGAYGSDWFGLLPRLFDRFLMVSRYSATLLDTPPARTRVIYGGVDPDRYYPDPSTDRQGVLFVGRITPHKGVDRLIQALPPGAQLTIAGSAGHDPQLPEREYPSLLRSLAVSRDVSFVTPAPDEMLPSLYRQAAVFVLPSVHHTVYGREIPVSELLGLVVLEAMASGTPVVCSRLGGLPEIVQHGVTGFLVDPGNVEELRERLSEVLGDTELARRMGRNARELVLERFTWRACAERCLSAYQEILRPTNQSETARS